jgi:hypothetical protein
MIVLIMRRVNTISYLWTPGSSGTPPASCFARKEEMMEEKIGVLRTGYVLYTSVAPMKGNREIELFRSAKENVSQPYFN